MQQPRQPDPRLPIIRQMKAARWSFQEIGAQLGISRQRAYQIFVNYKSKSNVKPARDHKVLTAKKRKLLNIDLPSIPNSTLKGRDHIHEKVRVRDNHTCQLCFRVWKPGQIRFDVHHIDEAQEGKGLTRGSYTYDTNNPQKMITLCHKCHMNLDTVRRKHSIAQNEAVHKLAA